MLNIFFTVESHFSGWFADDWTFWEILHWVLTLLSHAGVWQWPQSPLTQFGINMFISINLGQYNSKWQLIGHWLTSISHLQQNVKYLQNDVVFSDFFNWRRYAPTYHNIPQLTISTHKMPVNQTTNMMRRTCQNQFSIMLMFSASLLVMTLTTKYIWTNMHRYKPRINNQILKF